MRREEYFTLNYNVCFEERSAQRALDIYLHNRALHNDYLVNHCYSRPVAFKCAGFLRLLLSTLPILLCIDYGHTKSNLLRK